MRKKALALLNRILELFQNRNRHPKTDFGCPNTIRLTFNSLLVMIGDGVLGKARDMGGVVAEEARVEFGITFRDGV